MIKAKLSISANNGIQGIPNPLSLDLGSRDSKSEDYQAKTPDNYMLCKKGKMMSDAQLIYFEEIPDQEVDRACLDLRDVGLECKSCKMPSPGPWNSPEWIVPSAIILFIAKPYLQGFLGEMGKDHYGLLKKRLARLWSRFFSKDTTVPEFKIMSRDRIWKPEYTHTFSVVADTNDGRKFKLMFPADIDEDDFALHVEVFIDFVCRHYAGDEDAVVPSCFSVKGIDDQIFVTLAGNRRSVRFIDPLPRDIRNEMLHNQSSPADD